MDGFLVRRELMGRGSDGDIRKRRLVSKLIPSRCLHVNG